LAASANSAWADAIAADLEASAEITRLKGGIFPAVEGGIASLLRFRHGQTT
jgi:hypothetical protein